MARITKRLKNVWDAFSAPDRDISGAERSSFGGVSSSRPDRTRFQFSAERSIITSIYTRLAIDVASVQIRHIRKDDKGRYFADVESGLNQCLTLEANLDQAARAFRQDIVATLCSEGVAALVPVRTDMNPALTTAWDILDMRVGVVKAWFPRHVRVSVYNDNKGYREEITLPKRQVAIVENPLYSIMNEPNSTLQRLIRKLNLLDAIDKQSASGKLDLIIQLPYVIKSEARRDQANKRRKDIEDQLMGSQYGIAYTDGTEKITQLNRPAENNLMKQIEYLTTMLYGQLGLTEEVMNGTADEKTMLNYWNRTVEPIVDAIVEAMRRTFLTKTARSQKQDVDYFRDPFKLVPIENIAEIADKFTRNEILTSNEIRQIVGWRPSDEPKADQLINSNMPQAESGLAPNPSGDGDSEAFNSAMDEVDSELEKILSGLGGDDDQPD